MQSIERMPHDSREEPINSERFFVRQELQDRDRFVQMQAEQNSLPIPQLKRKFTATQLLTNETQTGRSPQQLGQHHQPLQAKLAIGQVGDRYEREADRVAKQVVGQIQNPVPPETRGNENISLQRQTPIFSPPTSSNMGMIQAKFMEARINKNTTIYDDDNKKPNMNKSQKVKKLKTAWLGSNPTVEVDPNQTYVEPQSQRRYVATRYNTTEWFKKKNYKGWIKWDHVEWKDNVIPELQHQVNDKFFGLASPFTEEVKDDYKGYAKRKVASLKLYKKIKVEQDPEWVEPYKKLSGKKKEFFEQELKIGQEIYESGNHKDNVPVSNANLIDGFEGYFDIPDKYLDMNDEQIKKLGRSTSEANTKRLDKHSREMIKSIKSDPYWKNKRWFGKTENKKDGEQRDAGHRSKLALRATIKTGQHVHFLLDGLEMEAVVNPNEKHYGSFTCKELRHAYRHWSEYRDSITFWLNEKPVLPPWDKEPELWTKYNRPTRRESIDDELPKKKN